MLRRVQLSRFRGFRELDVRVEGMTAIVGPNSCGKTTLLQAVRLACDAMRLALEEDAVHPVVRSKGSSGFIEVCSPSTTAVPDPTRLTSLADWQQLFTDAEVGENVNLVIRLEFDLTDAVQWLETTLVYGRNARLKMGVSVRSDVVRDLVAHLAPKSKFRPQALRERLRDVTPLAFMVPAFYGVNRLEEYRAKPVIDRMLGTSDQSRIVRNLVARLDGGALERLSGFLERSVGARIVHRTSQQDAEQVMHLTVRYRDTNGDLELSSAGAGLIALVALYSAMESVRTERTRGGGRSVVFLLDEPEAHLHPRLQGEVGVQIAQLAADFGVQLMLATHSVEMINRLGRRQGSLLLSVDRARSTAVVLESEATVVTALEAFCDLTPFTALSFLASRRVLFHEGPSDLRILAACARLLFRSNPIALTQWERYTAISLDGVGNVSAQGVLKKILTPDLFPQVQASDPVRIAVARDRDYALDAKLATRSTPAPHLQVIEAVWSRHSIESLFLDPPILAGWLTKTLGVPIEKLVPRVEQAVALADADVALNDAAEDGRMTIHRRENTEGQVLSERRARAAARADVRAEPARWQRGKDRARAILTALRADAALPKEARHRLRGAIDDLLANAEIDKLGDAEDLVPEEIRRLLGSMLDPITARAAIVFDPLVEVPAATVGGPRD